MKAVRRESNSVQRWLAAGLVWVDSFGLVDLFRSILTQSSAEYERKLVQLTSPPSYL